jgi:tetratricopeptide (TPR) repeat protein
MKKYLFVIVIILGLGGCMVAETALTPLAIAMQYLHMGKQLLNDKKDPQGAADSFQKALQINPELTEARDGLLAAYSQLGNPEKAKEFLSKLTGQNPLDEDAASELGLDANGLPDAGSDLMKGAQIDMPELDVPDLFENMELVNTIVNSWEDEIKQNPENPVPYYMLGIHYFQMSNYRRAQTYLESVVKIAPPGSQMAKTSRQILTMIGAK